MAYKETPMQNQNKGYESASQERSNLMNDNPIAKDASGGRGGSWMSKHSQSKMGGSPLMDKGHGGAEFSENHLSSGKHKSDLPGSAAMMVSPLNGNVGDALSKGGKAIGRGIKKLSNTTLGDVAEFGKGVIKTQSGVPAIERGIKKLSKRAANKAVTQK